MNYFSVSLSVKNFYNVALVKTTYKLATPNNPVA